jgi:HEAT repeat protein
MKRFFLSCCQHDLEAGYRVKTEIEKAGYSVWLDTSKFSSSDISWQSEIDQVIRESVAMVVLITPAANSCEFVGYEWAFALGARCPVIPLIVAPASLHPRLRSLNTLDFTSIPRWNKLADTLQRVANEQKSPSEPSPRTTPLKRRSGVTGTLGPPPTGTDFETSVKADHVAVRSVLTESLQHSMREVRIQASLMLAQFKEAKAVPVLIDALHERDQDTAQHAAWGLMNIGSLAVPDLINALSDANSLVRKDIVRILGQIGDATAAPALIDILRDEVAEVRRAAAESLGYIGSVVAVPPLLATLRDPEENVRRAGAEALGYIGDASAVLDLITALHDTSENVRVVATWALGQIRDTAAVPALISALREKNLHVRQAAAEMLKEIGTIADEPALSNLLQDEDTEVRRTAARVLAHIRSRYRAAASD